ncbi:MAG: hypothetical protein Tsb0019_41420 [Roseibium sp.]
MRVLECAPQAEGWPQVLDFIDRTLDCKSFLAEFDDLGVPTTRFGGQLPALQFSDILQAIETEGGRSAFQFLLSEASLFYPYCKTMLAGGRPLRTRPASGTEDPASSADEPAGIRAENEHGMHVAPGLISPMWRTANSTVLFGCLFTAHTPESIDAIAAGETFRTIVQALGPGLNTYFQMEQERLNSRYQRLLLNEVDGPAVLISADRDILAQTGSALELLDRAGVGIARRQKLAITCMKFEDALLRLGAEKGPAPGLSAASDNPRQYSVCVDGPQGSLMRISVCPLNRATQTQLPEGETVYLIRVAETREELPVEIEAGLQANYDLSLSEAHLARHLTMTGSLTVTVADLGISRNTAKTHLRRIYEKTGINTQLQLAKIVHRLAQLY